MASKPINPRIVQQELIKRAEQAKKKSEAPVFVLEDYCFDKQLKFIKDPAKFKTAVCSRRAGKSVSCAADLLNTAMNYEGDVAYITLNRITAKRILWRELLKINTIYQINAHVDNAELTLTLPNGNVIYVSGAKDASEIEKFRGIALRKVYIDECQSFRSYIEDLVQDVLEPALTDYDGSLILIGTPGPVPAGYFFNANHNPEWSNHHWTILDNPHIKRKSNKEPMQIIEERAKRRGIALDDPSILREYFGRWVKDENSLVYKFKPGINSYTTLPPGDWQYIFGIDIGYKDADAIAVLAYDFNQNTAYLVDELVTRKQDITALAEQIKSLQAIYNPIKMVMDAGALGKKIQEEIRLRHGLPIEAASKERKHEFISLLNGDLVRGAFKAKPDSRFAEDCNLVVWDWDDPLKPKISDKYHTDIGDAVLYAWREAKHYVPKTAKLQHKRDSVEWLEAQEAKEAEEMENAQNKHLQDWGVEDADLQGLYDE